MKNRFSVLGGILLVAGCSIGAAMLGLPVLSASSGLIPSSLLFIACWLFMMTTGLLALEVNLWFEREVNYISMARETLGKGGRAAAWLLYLFLFYSLMVAFVSGSGSLFSGFLEDFGRELPPWQGSLLFLLLFGTLVYRGTRAVDLFNRALMIGLLLSYLCLVFSGFEHVQLSLLKHRDWRAVWFVVPAMIVSFGYHNLIPSLATYFKRDESALKKTILFGSLLPLAMYLLWQALILGIVPRERFAEALDAGELATQALKKATDSASVVVFAELFALFALVSTFLSVSLSFVDFLADGFAAKKSAKTRALLCALVFAPPFFCSLLFPWIFLRALGFAGGYGAVLLFGILPALMVWRGRYRQERRGNRLVPGGRPALLGVIAYALFAVAIEAVRDLA